MYTFVYFLQEHESLRPGLTSLLHIVCAVEHDSSWHHRGSASGPAAQFSCAEESVAALPVSDRGNRPGK